jgi:hypothetical protein
MRCEQVPAGRRLCRRQRHGPWGADAAPDAAAHARSHLDGSAIAIDHGGADAGADEHATAHASFDAHASPARRDARTVQAVTVGGGEPGSEW